MQIVRKNADPFYLTMKLFNQDYLDDQNYCLHDI